MGRDTKLKPARTPRVYRRNLPHWEIPGSVYFITFRTADELALSDAAKDITFDSIKFHAGKKYKLYACVVMETHIHLILQPLLAQGSVPVKQGTQARTPVPPSKDDAFYSLAQIMHSIKSYSAKRIQKLLNSKGSVWLDENYDRVVRDDKEYSEKLNYIVNNPAKAGLVEKPEDYKWLYFEGKADSTGVLACATGI